MNPVIYGPCKLGWCNNGSKLSPALNNRNATVTKRKCNAMPVRIAENVSDEDEEDGIY